MKILTICNSLIYPSVEMSGMKAIYHTVKKVSENPHIEVTVVSVLPSWGKPLENLENLEFVYVNADSLLVGRIKSYLTAFRLLKKKDYYLVHDFSSVPLFSIPLKFFEKRFGLRTVHTICTLREKGSILGEVYNAPGLVDAFIFSEEQTFNEKKEKFPNIHFIPLHSDLTTFLENKYQRSAWEKKTVLFLGSLEERKGAAILAASLKHVVKKHPTSKFVFASYGKEARDPRHEANLNYLKNTLQGYEDHYEVKTGRLDVTSLMKEAAVFILPAVSKKGTLGQPLTLLEAIASSLPCVVSDIYREETKLLRHTSNCLLYRNRDEEDLAEKISSVLDDYKLAYDLGLTAQKTIQEDYGMEVVTGQLIQLYSSLQLSIMPV